MTASDPATTHGQPTATDLPVFFIGVDRSLCGVSRSVNFSYPSTRWIPLAELDALPDAPPPLQTVTIKVSVDDAREVTEHDWNPQRHFTWRVLAAVKAALEADEVTP